jgi:energy-coupling factor transporter ATP-binding protein EcfA2
MGKRAHSAMTAAVAITAEHVSHRYGQRLAVDDLSLEIAEGEVFAFLGPNGSGKTTLFRLLSTLIPLQQGEVAILGHDLRRDTTVVRRQTKPTANFWPRPTRCSHLCPYAPGQMARSGLPTCIATYWNTRIGCQKAGKRGSMFGGAILRAASIASTRRINSRGAGPA